MPLPAPKTWDDGDDPDSVASAFDVNTDWRDSWDFLLGYSRPMFYGHHTTGSVVINTATQTAVPFDTELLKRGGMVHSNVTNPSRVTVPYTGKYNGYAAFNWGAVSTLSSKFTCFIRKNGSTTVARPGQASPLQLANWELHVAFSIELAANDYIELTGVGTGTTTVTQTSDTYRCKIAIWYEGDAA